MSDNSDWILAYANRMRTRQEELQQWEAMLEAQAGGLWERFAEKAKELVNRFNEGVGEEYLKFNGDVPTEFSITSGDDLLLKAEWRVEHKRVECTVPNHDMGILEDNRTLQFDVDAAGNLCFGFDEHLLNAEQALRELLEPVLKHLS